MRNSLRSILHRGSVTRTSPCQKRAWKVPKALLAGDSAVFLGKKAIWAAEKALLQDCRINLHERRINLHEYRINLHERRINLHDDKIDLQDESRCLKRFGLLVVGDGDCFRPSAPFERNPPSSRASGGRVRPFSGATKRRGCPRACSKTSLYVVHALACQKPAHAKEVLSVASGDLESVVRMFVRC
jgi:hypothetical protein